MFPSLFQVSKLILSHDCAARIRAPCRKVIIEDDSVLGMLGVGAFEPSDAPNFAGDKQIFELLTACDAQQ